MQTPSLFSNLSPGDFRSISRRNREENQKRILDLRKSNPIIPNNSSDFPKKAYVINLDRRQDRWQQFQVENPILLKNFEVVRVSAEEGKFPQKSIFNSFLKTLRIGFLEDKQETIIVMEDDAYLAKGSMDKIKKAFADLPADWDILIGNHYFFSSVQVLSNHLAKPVGSASTLNFSIIRNTILEKIEEQIHLRENGIIGDFDHFVTSDEVKINNFTIWPMVSREYLSYSDHKGCVKDMSFRVRENAYLFPFVDSESYYPSLEFW